MSSTPTTVPGTHSSRSTGPAYRPEAATDGWRKIWDFYGQYLAS